MTEQNPAVQIGHEITAIKNYLIAAQDLMKSGQTPELAGLENRIAILCQSIKAAPQDTQKECLPELMLLLEQLNSCATDMRAAAPPGAAETGKS